MSPAMRTIFLQPSGRLRSGWRLALFIVLLVVSAAAMVLVLRALGLRRPQDVPGPSAPLLRLPAMTALVAVMLAVSAVFLRVTEGRTLSTLGLALRRSAIPGALLGLLVGAVPVALAVGIFGLLGVATVHPGTPPQGLVAPPSLASFGVTSLGSAMEELLWRGCVFQLLIEGGGRWVGALGSAVPWALLHADNPGANAAGILYLALSGILMAWAVIRTGSLWFTIAYHIAWNVTAAHLFGLTTSGFDLGASLLRTTLTGPAWLTGGAFGFEASFITETLDLLGLSSALLLVTRLPRIEESGPYLARRPVAAPAPASAPPPPS
jgi:hypothetical protein